MLTRLGFNSGQFRLTGDGQSAAEELLRANTLIPQHTPPATPFPSDASVLQLGCPLTFTDAVSAGPGCSDSGVAPLVSPPNRVTTRSDAAVRSSGATLGSPLAGTSVMPVQLSTPALMLATNGQYDLVLMDLQVHTKI
jgi:hypothetical protein